MFHKSRKYRRESARSWLWCIPEVSYNPIQEYKSRKLGQVLFSNSRWQVESWETEIRLMCTDKREVCHQFDCFQRWVQDFCSCRMVVGLVGFFNIIHHSLKLFWGPRWVSQTSGRSRWNRKLILLKTPKINYKSSERLPTTPSFSESLYNQDIWQQSNKLAECYPKKQ